MISKSFVDMQIVTQNQSSGMFVMRISSGSCRQLDPNAFHWSIWKVISYFVINQQIVPEHHPLKKPKKTQQIKDTLHILPTNCYFFLSLHCLI